MYYGPIFIDNPYKGCFECFCSLPNVPLMIDLSDKILPRTHFSPISSSSCSNITSCHDKDDATYIKYKGGFNPQVLETMGLNLSINTEPIILPIPAIPNPLSLTPL